MGRMSRRATWAAIFVVAAAVVVAGIWYFTREPSGEKSFRESCLNAARQVNAAKEAEVAQRRMCDCALDMLKAMPAADRKELETSEEKRQAFSAEVQRRCQ